jgi:hypothetical protein
VVVYAVVDDALSLDFPLGDSLDVFIRREDAERFIEEVRPSARPRAILQSRARTVRGVAYALRT